MKIYAAIKTIQKGRLAEEANAKVESAMAWIIRKLRHKAEIASNEYIMKKIKRMELRRR